MIENTLKEISNSLAGIHTEMKKAAKEREQAGRKKLVNHKIVNVTNLSSGADHFLPVLKTINIEKQLADQFGIRPEHFSSRVDYEIIAKILSPHLPTDKE